MVFLTLSKKVTSLIGPTLFRTGLAARNILSRNSRKDAPYLDMIFLVPVAQKLISLAIYDESLKKVSSYKDKTRVEKALDSTYDALFGKSKEDAEQEEIDISDIRIQVLDDNLRPALLPKDRWSDVLKWKWNARIIKWARKEFLVSKYGPQVKEALDAYPQLRASPQLSRHPTHKMLMNLARGRVDLGGDDSDSKKSVLLPSSETIIKAFCMRQWAKQKDSKRLRQTTMIPIVEKMGGNLIQLEDAPSQYYYAEEIPADTDLCDTNMKDILEVVSGGHVIHCGPFNAVCEEADIYQMWTQEYVQHLGDYLMDRCSSAKDTVILDIGAGDGLLMHFLREYMDGKGRGQKKQKSKQNGIDHPPTLVATDDGSWGIFAKAEVEKLNVQDTLEKYGKSDNNDEEDDGKILKEKKTQLIVLCSWMPMGQDWSSMFRAVGVDEYILIGEADDGSCGHNWYTWGNPDFYSPEENENRAPLPPYQIDSYQRWDMEVLSQFQFSRFDCAVSRSSKTISFRRSTKKTKS